MVAVNRSNVQTMAMAIFIYDVAAKISKTTW